MNIEQIIDGILAREQGYSNNPSDAGGETNWGITVTTARRNGYLGAMRNLPRDQARAIYKREYIVAPGFDKIAAIDAQIGAELVDSGVNCGTGRPGPWLQRTLNLLNQQGRLFPDLVVDGKIGPATVAALRAVIAKRGPDGVRVILRSLNGLQVVHYIGITEGRAQNEDFFFGWLLNRVEMA
jgi:lysozyme family protein